VGKHGAGEPAERRARRRELGQVVQGELAQYRLAPRRELDEDLPPIDAGPVPPDELARGEAIDQSDGTVVLDLEPLG
jgi:hypothetical protein